MIEKDDMPSRWDRILNAVAAVGIPALVAYLVLLAIWTVADGGGW